MRYGPAELDETFRELLTNLSSVLAEANVPWMLVGGLAAGVHTEPRGTKDCDIELALPDPPDALVPRLNAMGVGCDVASLRRVAAGGTLRVRCQQGGGPSVMLDILCAGTEFEHEALRRRRPAQLFGVEIPVATPDDLVVLKLIAGRPQDMADVDRLLRAGKAPEDEAYVRRWARAWDVEDRFDAALATARRV